MKAIPLCDIIEVYTFTWLWLWLWHYATIRQVAGSIPDGVIGIFQ